MSDDNGTPTNTERMVMPRHVGERTVRSWRDVRDKIAPQGTPIKAKDLVDRTFTILRMRAYQSQFADLGELVYWVVVVTDDGELLNCTLGGQAVVDVLDALSTLKCQYQDAVNSDDAAKQRDLEELGADGLWQFTLRWSEGGTGEGYYYFD